MAQYRVSEPQKPTSPLEYRSTEFDGGKFRKSTRGRAPEPFVTDTAIVTKTVMDKCRGKLVDYEEPIYDIKGRLREDLQIAHLATCVKEVIAFCLA